LDLLTNPVIVAQFGRAWQESDADDPAKRHEEGGYVALNPDLSHAVERWPIGSQARIVPPPLDARNCYNGRTIIAAFHTHPNPPIDESGQEWEQGPSESDRRWHQRRGLRGFVIGRVLVYEIDVNANVSVVGRRDEVLGA
jgi:hypothetical protein